MNVRINGALLACAWLIAAAPAAIAQAPIAAQPDGGVKPLAEKSPAPASEFNLDWQREISTAVLLRAVGYYMGMLAQLERIEKTIPSLATKSKEAADRIRALLSPGVEAIKAELRRRDPEEYERASSDLDANVRAEIEKIELTEKIARDAYEAGSWEPNKLPANVVTPLLAFSPRHLAEPAAVMEDGLTALLCQPIAGVDGKRICTLIPRSWSPDRKRVPKDASWALFSNMAQGAASMWVIVTPLEAGAGAEWTPEKIVKVLEENAPAEPVKVLSREIVTVGQRRLVVVTSESRVVIDAEAYDQYFQTYSWVEQDLVIDFTFAVGKARKADAPAIELATLKSVYEAHRGLIGKVLETVRPEKAPDVKPGEAAAEPPKKP